MRVLILFSLDVGEGAKNGYDTGSLNIKNLCPVAGKGKKKGGKIEINLKLEKGICNCSVTFEIGGGLGRERRGTIEAMLPHGLSKKGKNRRVGKNLRLERHGQNFSRVFHF